jgi:hypothetical protein
VISRSGQAMKTANRIQFMVLSHHKNFLGKSIFKFSPKEKRIRVPLPQSLNRPEIPKAAAVFITSSYWKYYVDFSKKI